MSKKYDYLIVGAGLYGAVFANIMHKAGKKCLIIEKNNHIGGLCYTEVRDGFYIHKYGPHIFHTKDKFVWNYINQFGEFNNYTHRVKAKHGLELYSFPINLQTFYELYNIKDPIIAQAQYRVYKHALFNLFIKEYSRKLWGNESEKIVYKTSIRLPIRFNFNDNYYDDNEYQGIPVKGYTELINNMIEGIPLYLGIDFLDAREEYENIADKIVYTGRIEELFNYKYGNLPYRSIYFDEIIEQEKDFQGIAQVNYVDEETPWLRITEHKHFVFDYSKDYTILTYEYPEETGMQYCNSNPVVCYPIEIEKNIKAHEAFMDKVKALGNYIIGGRLGLYKYMNMDQIIKHALNVADRELRHND